MRRIGFYLTVIMALASASAGAQGGMTSPLESDIYCGGTITTQAPPADFYMISGVESAERLVYGPGDLVFLNHGSKQGVKVGDKFALSRPDSDQVKAKWFLYQDTLLRSMGTVYMDVANVTVVSVQESTSTARITLACGAFAQRGDIAQPLVELPVPPLKSSANFDAFAPPSGKAKAMIVTTRNFGQLASVGTIVYVNLGSAQGVKTGDYFRVFRYQDKHHDSAFQNDHTAYQIFGFGSTPKPYLWSDVPRDVLGEGVVLRVGPNAATVLVTASLRDMYAGDYVELE